MKICLQLCSQTELERADGAAEVYRRSQHLFLLEWYRSFYLPYLLGWLRHPMELAFTDECDGERERLVLIRVYPATKSVGCSQAFVLPFSFGRLCQRMKVAYMRNIYEGNDCAGWKGTPNKVA